MIFRGFYGKSFWRDAFISGISTKICSNPLNPCFRAGETAYLRDFMEIIIEMLSFDYSLVSWIMGMAFVTCHRFRWFWTKPTYHRDTEMAMYYRWTRESNPTPQISMLNKTLSNFCVQALIFFVQHWNLGVDNNTARLWFHRPSTVGECSSCSMLKKWSAHVPWCIEEKWMV